MSQQSSLMGAHLEYKVAIDGGRQTDRIRVDVGSENVYSSSEVPHKPVLDPPHGCFHGAIFLSHSESAQTG